MLDPATATWPDFIAIIDTCRRPLKEAEVDLCFKSFAPLLKVFEEDGWVPDSKYLDLGFPVDKNWAGEPVHRDASITNEICQRSKLLSALTQRRLRCEQAEKQAAKLSAETELGNAKILAVLADNKASFLSSSASQQRPRHAC